MKIIPAAALLLLDRVATMLGKLLHALSQRLHSLATWARTKAGTFFPLLLVTTAVASLRIVSAAILLSPIVLLGAFI